MSTAEALMQSYYAARAPEYDRVYQKPERQAALRVLQQWLPPLFAGTRLLEVACGTGFWTQFIAQAASEVVAVDAAPETMSIAQTRVPEHKVKFLVGDAYRLPQDQGRFNAAFAGFWFSHVPKERQREFITVLGNVLTPGARVVLLDNLYVEGSNHPTSEKDPEGNTYQTRRLDDGSTHRVLKNFPSEAELRSVIAGLGAQALFTTFEYYWAFQYVAVKP
ncbi:MAG TPA: class I SAM-dependent methyltransferase [Burkholderiales bacterium]|nr:class I SAM-dependent methyltransferase [Burkholderiales bacterium]